MPVTVTQQIHTVFLQVERSSFGQLRELLKTPPGVVLQCLQQHSSSTKSASITSNQPICRAFRQQ